MNNPSTGQVLNQPLPYNFPPMSLAQSPGLFPMALCNGLQIEEATIDVLQAYMDIGLLDAATLVQCYIQRIIQVDPYVK